MTTSNDKLFTSAKRKNAIQIKEIYFTLLSEKGKRTGNKKEYLEKYANWPLSKEPLVWMNLIAGTYSIQIRGKRSIIKLSGRKRNLLHLLLKRFNERIPMNELEEKIPNHPQFLNDLHKDTFGVLRSFMDKEPGEYRILRPNSKRNPKRKFTFFLIEPYKENNKNR